MIPVEKLDFWLKNRLNVLFEGKHGIGKTTIVREAFERNKLSYAYMSAATMDPWVDFIGIPKEYTDEDGETYIKLVRPKNFAKDMYDVIFIDELNRAPKKLRNALLELIQFRTINGQKFERLQCIWGAINPDTQENIYDVERLDPAQYDRFKIHYSIDYAPDVNYFTGKFGPTQALSAVDWWNGLTEEAKQTCSPRRLDYALELYNIGGDMRDCLHKSTNVSKLVESLETGIPLDGLKKLYNGGQWEQAKIFLANENNFHNTIDWIVAEKDRVKALIPLISEERISNTFTTHPASIVDICSQWYTSEAVRNAGTAIIDLEKDGELIKKLRDAIPLLESANLGTNPLDVAANFGWDNRDINGDAMETILNEMFDVDIENQPEDRKIQALADIENLLGKNFTFYVAKYIIRQSYYISLSMPERGMTRAIGIINFVTKTGNIDLRSDPEFREIVNTSICQENDHLLWIPATGASS